MSPFIHAAVLVATLAVREPPDYRGSLAEAAAAQAEALNAEGHHEEAIDFAATVQRAIGPAAVVQYEVGYAYNRLGDLDAAVRAYDRALELDPHLAAALYDRGELLLLKGRDEEARADFEAAAALRPDHWAVHFRLAELAGRAADAPAFERHLIDALSNGFDFRTIIDDPGWRAWFRDPALGPVLTKLVVVYSDERLLDRLQEEP